MKWIFLLPAFVFALHGQAHAAVYQKSFDLTCVSNSCAALLPKVAANKTLIIDTVSCVAIANTAVTGGIGVFTVKGNTDFFQYFKLERTHAGVLVVNVERVPATVKAGKQIELQLGADAAIAGASCSLRGTIK